jgi:tRNA (cmo5U34)-methyltransferase
MLDEAVRVLESANVRDRVTLHEGYIEDAPEGPFDGATCILTMHFIIGEDRKLETLREIRRRLRPGARFILVALSMEPSGPDFEKWRSRFLRWVLDAGMDPTDASERHERLATGFHLVSPQRQAELLEEAGFTEVDPFFAALCWRGWTATAG